MLAGFNSTLGSQSSSATRCTTPSSTPTTGSPANTPSTSRRSWKRRRPRGSSRSCINSGAIRRESPSSRLGSTTSSCRSRRICCRARPGPCSARGSGNRMATRISVMERRSTACFTAAVICGIRGAGARAPPRSWSCGRSPGSSSVWTRSSAANGPRPSRSWTTEPVPGWLPSRRQR